MDDVLAMFLQIRAELARKYLAGTATRYDGHRLIETCHAIAELTGRSAREVWTEAGLP